MKARNKTKEKIGFEKNMGVSKNRDIPKWIFNNGNLIKMDDLGVPLFLETSIYIYIYMYIIYNIYKYAPNNPQQLLCLNFTTCFNLNLRRSNSSCQSSAVFSGFLDQDFGMNSRQGPFFVNHGNNA